MVKLSKEWMQKTIIKLGFTEIDAQVYVFLSKEGSKKARDMAEALNLTSQQLYRILKKLQKKGMVNVSHEYPASFSAVIFERILDLLVKSKKEQQKALQESKKELLSTWRSITEKANFES